MSLDPLTHRPNSLGPKRWCCHHLLVSLLTVSLISIGLSDAPAQQFSIGTSFQATTLEESGFIVPDTMGAVGPQHVALLLNGRFVAFDKTGTPLVSKSLNDFWNDAGVTPAGEFAFDPRILYDHFSGRWFGVSVDNHGGANNFLVAVSATDDPTGSWSGFQIDSDPNDSRWADFPTLGLNHDVVALGANMFPIASGGYSGSGNTHRTLLVLPKSELTAPVPSVANATLLENLNTSFAPQPIVDLDNGNLPLPVLSEGKSTFGFLALMDIAGPATSPTLDITDSISFVTLRDIPPPIDQPGPKANLHAQDTRFTGNAVKLDGSVWAAHGVEFDGRAAIEWYELNAGTKDVVQSGLLSDPELGLSFPSIAVNSAGDVVIGFSAAGPNTFAGAYAAVGKTVNDVTTFGPITELEPGLADYERLDSQGRNRWGDYSATVNDPLDPNRFWTFQEFALSNSSGDQWAVQAIEIIVPEPSTALLLCLCLVAVAAGRWKRQPAA